MSEPVELSRAIEAPGDAWDQGDIVAELPFYADDARHPAVLITPGCDVEQDKIPFWTFIALFRECPSGGAQV